MHDSGAASTVLDALRDVAAVLEEARVGDTPRLDAELLVGHVTQLDRVGLRVHSDRTLEPGQWRRLDELVGRRRAGEPVAYLLGTAWFYGREFEVDRRVLVPRPETELLVEQALTHFADSATSGTFIDACTGSGCVAVTIAAELGPRARVVATDISHAALEVARANARRHGVDVEFRCGDLLEPAADVVRVAAVVANPPYVEEATDDNLDAAVREHEPHVALFAPADGLEALYGRLARQAVELLEPGGLFAVEHGVGQRAVVSSACHDAGLVEVAGLDDLAGIDRVVVGYRARGGDRCS